MAQGDQLATSRVGKERAARLEEAGFQWNPIDATWENMFEALRVFKGRHGHCDVPQKWPDDQVLANWVGTQRLMYHKGSIKPDRRAKLTSLGFHWNAREARWQRMFSALVRYRQNQGHCIVPANFPDQPDLGRWVVTQRRFRRLGKLSETRIRQLDELGFQWSL